MGIIDGRNIELGSTPLDRLAEKVTSISNFNSHVADNINPHGTKLYQDELVIGGTVLLKSNADTLFIRNTGDTEDFSLYVKNITLSQDGAINQITVNELALEDAFINLNSEFVGTPTEDMGIRLNRGSDASLRLFWDEGDSRWMVDVQDTDGGPVSTWIMLHDGNAYTAVQADDRFVNVTGDIMTGALRIDMDTESKAMSVSSTGTSSVIDFYDSSTPFNFPTTMGTENGYAFVKGNKGNKLIGDTYVYDAYQGRYIKFVTGTAGNASLDVKTNAGVSVALDIQPQVNIKGGLDVNSKKITNVANPEVNSDALNLGFADDRYFNVTGDTITGTLNVATSYINLGTGNLNADGGMIVRRNANNAILYWDESTLRWICGTTDSVSPIVTEDDLTNPTNIETIQDIVGDMVISNTENGIVVTYNDGAGKIDFDVNDFVLTLNGDVSGSATCTNLGSFTLTTVVADDSHTHTAATLPDFTNDVLTIIANAVTNNTENGINVTYNSGKLNFDVNDPLISLTGDVSGSATMTNLSNVSINTTVADDSHNHTNLTGTTSDYFNLNSDSTGVRLEAASAQLSLRNMANSTYADLHIGSLYQHGTVVNIYGETMTVADNIILVNSNVTGAPTEHGGLEVQRGTSTNSQILWNETADAWYCGVIGDLSRITRYDNELSNYILDSAGGMVSGNTENGITVTYSSGKLHFDVNDPVITLTGDVSGSATMTNLGNTTITANVADDSHYHTISTLTNFNNNVLGLISSAVTGNTETGIDVTYNSGKLNFVVPSTTVTLSGDASGSASFVPGQTANINVTVNDSSVNAGAVNGLKVARITGYSFSGYSNGRYVPISGFYSTDYSVAITPIGSTNYNLGDVYVVKYSGYMYVYNTGAHSGAFEVIVTGTPA